MDRHHFLRQVTIGIKSRCEYAFTSLESKEIDGLITDWNVSEKSDSIAVNVVLQTEKQRDDLEEFIVFRKNVSELDVFSKSYGNVMLLNSSAAAGDGLGLKRIENPQTSALCSFWYTVIGNNVSNKYLFFGFQHPVQHRTFLRLRDGYLECGCIIQRNLMEGDSFKADTLLIRASSTSPHELLEWFGNLCTTDITPRKIDHAIIGWNSWDYYFRTFDENDLRETIETVKSFNRRSGVKVKMLMLDDGWFNDYGDWQCNGRFPSGLKGVADLIKANGFEPGIWLAPFIVHYYSKTYLRSRCGLVSFRAPGPLIDEWFGPAGFVDPTSAAGEKFLIDTFTELKAAGFRWFKTDFLNYMITHGPDKKFTDDRLGRIEIIRKGLMIIREAIGDDSRLITCGCPPEASIGIANANRTGGDISTYTSTVKCNINFLAGRYWMNNRFFTADPDFLIVRCDATADDRDHNPVHLRPVEGSRSGPPWQGKTEARLWASLQAMSGGLTVLADHLGKLNDAGVEILKTAICHSTDVTAVPLDLMENKLPEIWLRSGERPALLLVNWTKQSKILTLPYARYSFLHEFHLSSDIWEGRKLDFNQEDVRIKLSAYDVAWFIKEHNTK